MIHPSILRTYDFHRVQRQINPVDACTDTAHCYDINVHTLAAFLRAIGIDADHLRNL